MSRPVHLSTGSTTRRPAGDLRFSGCSYSKRSPWLASFGWGTEFDDAVARISSAWGVSPPKAFLTNQYVARLVHRAPKLTRNQFKIRQQRGDFE